jgi:hypothetical protein
VHPEQPPLNSSPGEEGASSSPPGKALAGQPGHRSWSGPKVSTAAEHVIIPSLLATAAVPTGHWQVGNPPTTTQLPESPQE